MIKLTNISKYYDYSSGRTYALRNVSLTIDRGESVAIVGKSGAGKTDPSQHHWRSGYVSRRQLFL